VPLGALVPQEAMDKITIAKTIIVKILLVFFIIILL
jgi:hypothetical protein